MTEHEVIVSHIEECKHRINVIKNYVKTNKDANAKRCERNIFILETIIKVLEKQIPKKVDEDDCCPLCHTYGKDDNGVEGLYCPNCGQKLDWWVMNEDAD